MLLIIYNARNSPIPGKLHTFGESNELLTHSTMNMDSGESLKEEQIIDPSQDRPSEFIERSSADFTFVAQYLNQDPDLWVFRRFGKLHLFNILCLQQRLAKLENTLEEKVWKDETEGFESLWDDIKIAVKEYGTASSPLKAALSPFYFVPGII